MVLLVCLLVVGCSNGDTAESPAAASRGELLAATPVLDFTAAQTTAYLTERKLPAATDHAVQAYRVSYTTVDPAGAPTTATGLVVLPDAETAQLRLVSFAHGTTVRRDEGPSVDGATARARTVMFAAAGYAAIAPDYLGLGLGPGPHPYAHAPSEASASADLLVAARTFLAQQGHRPAPEVLVSGFSQGGQAAVAFARELHRDAVPGFELGGLAAVSGPYAVQQVQAPAALDGRVGSRQAVLYLAYWITAMNRIYHLYSDPAEAFREPYAGQVEALFDGHHDILAVTSGLPHTPQELLTPRYLEWAQHPDGAAQRAMADSDTVCDWTAQVPVRLYAAPGDRSVPFENTQHCMKDELGASAELVDLGDKDHGATARTALPQILDWFRGIAPPV